MTLILTAIGKNGISVCADKRYRTKNIDGSVINNDANHKIFEFSNIPIVILNHGINKFKNRDWKDYCSDYETSGRWKGKNQYQIVYDFKDFIEKIVTDELNLYKNEKYAIGFLVCGRTPQDTKYKINELFWIIENGLISFQVLRHKGLIKTGDDNAKRDVEYSISNNNRINTEDYWKSMKPMCMENELKRIFLLAVGEKRKRGGDEFSDEFETKCI